MDPHGSLHSLQDDELLSLRGVEDVVAIQVMFLGGISTPKPPGVTFSLDRKSNQKDQADERLRQRFDHYELRFS